MEPHHFRGRQQQQQQQHSHPQQQQQLLQLPYAAITQLHPQQFQQQQEPLQGHDTDHQQQQQPGTASSGDRLPQWSADETRELLTIRADMDRSFMETKRNKPLWQAISDRMRALGFERTPDQCKCKWKNLVTRYKGSESMEAETNRHSTFPYQADMRRIFSHRMEALIRIQEQAHLTSDQQGFEEVDHQHLGNLPTKQDFDDTDLTPIISHDPYLQTAWTSVAEFDQDSAAPTPHGAAASASTSFAAPHRVRQDPDEPSSTSKRPRGRKPKRAPFAAGTTRAPRQGVDVGGAEKVKKALREFLGWQMRAEEYRMQMVALREAQRREADREWRRVMEVMAVERAERDRQWRIRQEERRAREEDREERRHQLILALLNKLNATTSSTHFLD